MKDPYFFGYGSLVNTATHDFPDPQPARLRGWRRAWRHTDLRPIAFLTAIPDEACEIDGLIEREAYKPWFMHRTGHWLGMDVHDVGLYALDGAHRRLEPGMVTTVEPGLYFRADDTRVPEALRGIGVRIEDDVLVTAGAPDVLTAGCVKTVDDVERVCAEAPRLIRA